MTDAEIIKKVNDATIAYEEIPFKELVDLIARKSGPRIAAAHKPGLVNANQTLRFILDTIQS